MDHLCYICLVCVMLSRLFIAALWSPAWKGLTTSWLLFVMFNRIFVTFSCGNVGQVWYLIVLIPYLCRFTFTFSNGGHSFVYFLLILLLSFTWCIIFTNLNYIAHVVYFLL